MAMKVTDVAKAVDIHAFLDRLEETSDIATYYKINHLTPSQRDQIALAIARTLATELKSMGLRIDS